MYVFMDYLPAWMFVVLFGLLLIGYPVAFTIGALAILFGWIGFGLSFFHLLPLRIWGVMQNFTLVAVPLFVFMGVTLERSGLAEELLDTMAILFGKLRGGLAISVIVVGALLAASTGIVGATTVTMGLLALPSMMRRNYSPELATGTIAASGTLGQIIPPSIVLVVLADIMNISVGDLFVGAILPGFLLVGLYLIFIIVNGIVRPDTCPPVPPEELAAISGRELMRRTVVSMMLPLSLMLAVLGSIFAGIASPTEAAAVGASFAMLLAMAMRKFSMSKFREVMLATVRLTSMIFIILVGAQAFGLTFRGLGGDELIRNFLTDLNVGPNGVLAMVMVTLFLAGFFLDFIEITFIHVPVLTPIMAYYGFDPTWFAILIAVNLQTSFLTPPFGYALFYLKSVCPPGVTTIHIYKGIVPFVILQLIGLTVVVFFPQLVLYLPCVIFGSHCGG
ncbi:MAG: TRAP transporter large permease subunit [SAR324 cluster bacterium]|nr:TRAP transporter large permease subunit [SAR324 cluster bacterium]MCZ6841941.1 TRAP transporter large permease subunit [SAR324 cluster bacterium]